jgi:hypothetical protein
MQLHGVSLTIGLSAVHDAIHDHAIRAVDLELDTIVADSQPVLRRVVCKLLHISLKIVSKSLQRIRDPRRLSLVDSPKVLDSFRLEVDRVFHAPNLTHISTGLKSECGTNAGNDLLQKALVQLHHQSCRFVSLRRDAQDSVPRRAGDVHAFARRWAARRGRRARRVNDAAGIVKEKNSWASRPPLLWRYGHPCP